MLRIFSSRYSMFALAAGLGLFALALVAGLAPSAQAAQEKTFAVAPFAVHGPEKYAYLGQGISSMLASRLTWKDHLQPLDGAKVRKAAGGPVDSAGAAQALRGQLEADYLVYGSTTILGDNASLDVRVLSAQGQAFTAQESMPLAQVIPGLEAIAQRINASIFERPAETALPVANVPRAPQPKGAVNPGFVPAQGRPAVDEDGLNPNFRYENGGEDEGRWRSGTLPFKAERFAVGDVDGGGDNEVVFVAGHTLHVYKLRGNDLQPLTTYDLPRQGDILNVTMYDAMGDGREEIIVSTWRDRVTSYVVGYEGSELAMLQRGLNFHVRAILLPPTYRRVLVGQQDGHGGLFKLGEVRLVQKQDGELTLGPRIKAPDGTNLYGLAYMETSSGEKTVFVTPSEIVKIFTAGGELQAATEEKYNGSAVGVPVDDTTMPGMGQPLDRERLDFFTFIPMEPVVTDLNHDGKHELLLSRNLSVAAQFFQFYRSFSQGEIHSMEWDGVNLTLDWKTRRIRGTVIGYTVADVDNDGADELVVALNTYTGSLGLSTSKALLLAYDLDTPEQ